VTFGALGAEGAAPGDFGPALLSGASSPQAASSTQQHEATIHQFRATGPQDPVIGNTLPIRY